MLFLPVLLTKLKNSAAVLAGFFKGLPGKIFALLAGLREKSVPSGKLFRGKGKWLLIGLGAALILLLFFFAAVLVMSRNSRSGPPPAEELTGPAQGVRIPREELFLPDEPDFIPGVLLERERREVWTAEDAAPYWRDPLKGGEEPWREQAESVIDELLERVP